MDWTIKSFEQLTPLELYQCLRLREQVFFLEQQVDCEDLDDLDQHALHLFAGDPVTSYCRVFGPEMSGYCKIGRVVVAATERGKGVGQAIMRSAIELCRSNWPEAQVKISAQSYLRRFYEDLGFVVSGPVYDEGGIPHYPMRLA